MNDYPAFQLAVNQRSKTTLDVASGRQVELVVDNLQVAYDACLALDLEKMKVRGNTVAVIGHNGAGKSTLIKTILQLINPRRGKISISSQSRGKLRKLIPSRDMAFCPETGAVFADISVESYIKLWCRIKTNSGYSYLQEGVKYIESLNIPPLFSKLGRELSKGERRRVQTAIGFLTRPKLFLFDEPFSGLDVQKARELGQIINNNSAEMAFILSSHRMDIVERLADFVIVLREGKVAASGTVPEVSSQLAGNSIVIRGVSDTYRLIAALRKTFPRCLVNRLGDHISIIGKRLDLDLLKSRIAIENQSQAIITREQPSLVDALNCHLSEAPNLS